MAGSTLSPGRGPVILAPILDVAGAEEQVDLQTDPTGPTIKKLMILSRDATKYIQVRFKNSGDYFTIHAGRVYWDDGLDCFTLSLFLTGEANGQVAEILYWN